MRAIDVGVEAHVIDDQVHRCEAEREAVVVPELGVAERVRSMQCIERQRVQEHPQPMR